MGSKVGVVEVPRTGLKATTVVVSYRARPTVTVDGQPTPARTDVSGEGGLNGAQMVRWWRGRASRIARRPRNEDTPTAPCVT